MWLIRDSANMISLRRQLRNKIKLQRITLRNSKRLTSILFPVYTVIKSAIKRAVQLTLS